MIKHFKCKEAEKIYHGQRSFKLPQDIQQKALDKLVMLASAGRVEDLRVPPGNKLEKLSGDRMGQYSIRINAQWRLCFSWTNGNAYQTEIVDYH